MTWLLALQFLGPGLIALAGAWRANNKTGRRLAAALVRIDALEVDHATCTSSLEALRDELGLKRRVETAGGGSLMHVVAHIDDTGPITRKQRKP